MMLRSFGPDNIVTIPECGIGVINMHPFYLRINRKTRCAVSYMETLFLLAAIGSSLIAIGAFVSYVGRRKNGRILTDAGFCGASLSLRWIV